MSLVQVWLADYYSNVINYYTYVLDINECSETPCEHNCTNTIGSFNCSCNDGYVLDENGRSCNGMCACHNTSPMIDWYYYL